MVNVMGEKVTIVGYRDVSFTDDSGKSINGRSYYFNMVADGVQGLISGKLFVSADALSRMSFKPIPGDDVIVYYNRHGKPAGFEECF